MKETQRRIKEYQAKLPRMKEKVLAVLLLLAMSTSMLVTVSFAWVALSTSPEVTGVNTSIASNGNLEIALASGTMDHPNDVAASAVGDSILSLLERNITWGNLINLSDPAYGLDSLVLRPALLNKSNLLYKPLHGPIYDASGRICGTDTNFGYAALYKGVFEATDVLGIRAITSMESGESGESATYNKKLNLIEAQNINNKTKYQSMGNNQEYMDALASMMAGYMIENIFKNDPDLSGSLNDAKLLGNDVDQLILMYEELISCYEEQAKVFASLLNLSAELWAVNNDRTEYPSITSTELMALSYDKTTKVATNALLSKGFTTDDDNSKIGFVKTIDEFLYDYHLLQTDVERLRVLRGSFSTSVTWKNSKTGDDGIRIIDSVISNFVNVTMCQISGGSYRNLAVSKITAGSALGLMNAGVCETKITNGVLFNFDNFTGAHISNPKDKPLTMTVDVKMMGSQSITSNVSTSATENRFENERVYVESLIKRKFGDEVLVAKDSYGFAVDFWVRTNALNSYLTLQGNVLTETVSVEVMGKDLYGEEVEIYTISVKHEGEGDGGVGDLLSDMRDIYPSTDVQADGETIDCWRYASNHVVVEQEVLDAAGEPLRKIETEKRVIGYEGANRVWEGDEHAILTVNSSTQGSGSCYVFYAENPVDEARIKVLLKSMKVAFVDDKGTCLAQAFMNSDLAYSTTGKVIVPLMLDSESDVIGVDNNGDPIYAITVLEQNVPKRITAIVYLDGEEVGNQHVLAASDIQGQMNIQFGSSTFLKALDNEDLYNSEIHVDAEITGETEFEYGSDTAMTTTVKVTVDGIDASKVEANFIRKINATQGSREESFILNDDDGDGVWEGSYTFTSPGEYILRSVRVDDVERDLQLLGGETFPTVTVKGFTIASVTYAGVTDGQTILSDKNFESIDVMLTFATNDRSKMPNKVVGQFLRKDGVVATVDFAYDSTAMVWSGKATFVSSGEYTMQYVILDGEYVELAETQWCTIDLTLGMRVRVKTESPTRLTYGDPSTPESLKMMVEILDNNGELIPSLGRVELYYTRGDKQLAAKLTWVEGSQCYEGEFRVEVGIWSFQRVQILIGAGEDNASNLYTVNADAPVFTIISPTPPSFNVVSGNSAQFLAHESDNASIEVSLRDSDSATVYGKLVSKIDGTVLYVKGTRLASSRTNDETFEYSFAVKDSGKWRLESVSAFDVFDEDQKPHFQPLADDGSVKAVETEAEYQSGIVFEAPLEIAVLRAEDVAVNAYYVEDNFAQKNEAENALYFGKKADGTLSDFMAKHTFNAGSFKLTFADNYGLIRDGVFTISSVSCGYGYANHDPKYGGYTATDTVSLFAPGKAYGVTAFTMTTTDPGNISGVAFANSNEVTFRYAAQYKLSDIIYTVGNDDVKVTAQPRGTYAIEVWSKKPELKWTSVSPETLTYVRDNVIYDDGNLTDSWGDTSIDCIPISSNNLVTNGENIISSDGYSAEVFFKVGYKKKGNCGEDANKNIIVYNQVEASKATVTLYNVDDDGDFTCSFTYIGEKKTYGGRTGCASHEGQAIVTFTLSNGKMSSTQEIGYKQLLAGQSLYATAGVDALARVVLGPNTLSVDTITITYEGLDVQITLDHPLKLTNKY